MVPALRESVLNSSHHSVNLLFVFGMIPAYCLGLNLSGVVVRGTEVIWGPAKLATLHIPTLGGLHHDGRKPLRQLGEPLEGVRKDLYRMLMLFCGLDLSADDVGYSDIKSGAVVACLRVGTTITLA